MTCGHVCFGPQGPPDEAMTMLVDVTWLILVEFPRICLI